MILVDEERVELFSAMKSDLADSEIYCWSEMKMDGGDIKVSRTSKQRLPSVECERDLDSDAFPGPRDPRGFILERPGSWSRKRCGHLLHLWVCLQNTSSANDSTGGRPKAVLSTQRMALSNLWSGFVGELDSLRFRTS